MAQRTSPRLYFESIAPRWTREAKAANGSGMLILSPYVTSTVADTVARNTSGKVSLYTVFAAELFATGASGCRSMG